MDCIECPSAFWLIMLSMILGANLGAAATLLVFFTTSKRKE